MSRRPPLLFHVGYHKTATTWMQNKLFTPEHGYQQIMSTPDAFSELLKPHGLRFDPDPLRDRISALVAALDPEVVPVISSENISGHPFLGGRESEAFAQRLKTLVPEARILISIRAQLRILPSVYMQYLLRGGTMSHAQFFEQKDEIGYHGFTPQHFEYDLLVKKYQDLFGAENVYVQTQESLQKDMEAAARDLAAFTQNTGYQGLVPEALTVQSASYPEYTTPVLRRINHVQHSTLNPRPIVSFGTTPKGLYKLVGFALKKPPFSTLLSGRKPVSDYVKRRFTGHFADSNARLQEICAHPLDLSRYG